MIGKGSFPDSLILLSVGFCIVFSQATLLADGNKQQCDCLNQAVKRIIEIRSLPKKKYLHTLDGQRVLLKKFHAQSSHLFPQCYLFKKFYYWQSDIREVISNTKTGQIRHRIRSYHNCLSVVCPHRGDPRKTHGDVAEFYDQEGIFMGLAVYAGDGQYCALPYEGYQK